MKTRPVAAAFFVICCLLLCGLILRRQIAAHPLPPETAQRGGGYQPDGDGRGDPQFWMKPQNWHPAPAPLAAEMEATIQGQIAAFNRGDGAGAASYQDRTMRQKMGNPMDFMHMISSRYPEFAQSRKVQVGPIWIDKSKHFGQAIILVEGKDGEQIDGKYLLVREGGQFKVANVFSHRLPIRVRPVPPDMRTPKVPAPAVSVPEQRR